MIRSREDLNRYLEADRVAGGKPARFGIHAWLADPAWRYTRLLRKHEYLVNCKGRKGFGGLWRLWTGLRLSLLGQRLGITMWSNIFDEGLYIPHWGTIVVHEKARIGKNCTINAGVNIGNNEGRPDDVPTIGDNCFIGPGAKIFGRIVLGDNVRIGANAVVNRSFPEGNCTLVGIPAHKV